MAASLALLRDRAHGLKASLGATARFRRDLYPHWRALLGAFVSAVGYTATGLAEPWPLKFIFDSVLGSHPLRTPFPWLNAWLGDNRLAILTAATVAILLLALLRGLFYYTQNILTSRVGQSVVMQVRARLFAHVQRLPLNFHARSSTGDLLTRLTGDILLLRELMVASLLSLLSESVIIIGYIAVMFLMDATLALLSLIVVPVIFGLVTLYTSRIKDATRKQRRREGELASRLHETLTGIHVVQLFARENLEDERLVGLNQRSLSSGLKAARLEAQLNRIVELALAAGTAVTLWYGALQVMANRLTPGDLIVFVAYMQSFYRPLRRISRIAERATKAGACVERITEVMDLRSTVPDGWFEAPRFRGEIHFDQVNFGYSLDRPILRSINATVRPGETVALVGYTGAGKTTLLGLIPRLYDPTRGRVRIDGESVHHFTLASLRRQISVVPQDGMLFSGTIRDNIAYGKLGATDAEIEQAARAAHIHDFIVELPNGYDTVIGERGLTLSGGQRQRLAIARALIKDAPIVLLDEPTTGLDAESEALVMAALDRLLTGRTALVIAHRFSTIRRADMIWVVNEGALVERGTHTELLARGELYATLYELQFADQAAAPEVA